MIKFQKPTVFKIEKIYRKENDTEQNSDIKYKVSKKRIPWTKEVTQFFN